MQFVFPSCFVRVPVAHAYCHSRSGICTWFAHSFSGTRSFLQCELRLRSRPNNQTSLVGRNLQIFIIHPNPGSAATATVTRVPCHFVVHSSPRRRKYRATSILLRRRDMNGSVRFGKIAGRVAHPSKGFGFKPELFTFSWACAHTWYADRVL